MAINDTEQMLIIGTTKIRLDYEVVFVLFIGDFMAVFFMQVYADFGVVWMGTHDALVVYRVWGPFGFIGRREKIVFFDGGKWWQNFMFLWRKYHLI